MTEPNERPKERTTIQSPQKNLFGWVCSVCGQSNAPSVKQCPCRGLPPEKRDEGTVPLVEHEP